MTQHGHRVRAAIFRALAHSVRLQILELLGEQEMCVCDLIAVLHRRQAYVSQQLAVLREAGLVVDRREGSRVFYCLVDDSLADLLAQATRLGDHLETSSAREG